MLFSEKRVSASKARVAPSFVQAEKLPKGLKDHVVSSVTALLERWLEHSRTQVRTVSNNLQNWTTLEDLYFKNCFGLEKSRATRLVQIMETRMEAFRKVLKAIEDGCGDLDEVLIEVISIGFLSKTLRSALKQSSLQVFSNPDTKVIDPLIEEAMHGNTEADRRLRLLAFGFIIAGKPLPEPLREYVCKLLFGQGPKLTPGPRKLFDRDVCIVETIQSLIDRGTPVTKAQRLVLKALDRSDHTMTEDALEKVWKQRVHRGTN